MSSPPPRRCVTAELTDRDLVRLYWPVKLRPAFDALFALDDALAEIALRASQPALAAITLAWWSEALDRLDTHAPPAEPRLQAVVADLLPRGLNGRALATLVAAWTDLLDQDAGAGEAAARGQCLFGLAATLLGTDDPGGAGAAFGMADLLRRTGDARWSGAATGERSTKPLRPLTAFDALGTRDLRRGLPCEAEATPARAWTLLRHRWTGRV